MTFAAQQNHTSNIKDIKFPSCSCFNNLKVLLRKDVTESRHSIFF